MEVIRRFLRDGATPQAAYLALELALMRRYVARGGSPEEFCATLAPAFRKRWGPILLEGANGNGTGSPLHRAA